MNKKWPRAGPHTVLQLTNESTNMIAGKKLLKPIQRLRKLLESKVEECYEIKAIVQELKIGRRVKEDSIKDCSSGIEAELDKYKRKILEDMLGLPKVNYPGIRADLVRLDDNWQE